MQPLPYAITVNNHDMSAFRFPTDTTDAFEKNFNAIATTGNMTLAYLDLLTLEPDGGKNRMKLVAVVSGPAHASTAGLEPLFSAYQNGYGGMKPADQAAALKAVPGYKSPQLHMGGHKG